MQTVRRVENYGCELRNSDAIELAEVLTKTEFSVPKRRKKRVTFEQVQVLRRAAIEARQPSIALAVTLQFDLGLRQKDVMGEWIERGEGAGGCQWGLTWQHIGTDLVLKKSISKSNRERDGRARPQALSRLDSHPARSLSRARGGRRADR